MPAYIEKLDEKLKKRAFNGIPAAKSEIIPMYFLLVFLTFLGYPLLFTILAISASLRNSTDTDLSGVYALL